MRQFAVTTPFSSTQAMRQYIPAESEELEHNLDNICRYTTHTLKTAALKTFLSMEEREKIKEKCESKKGNRLGLEVTKTSPPHLLQAVVS